MRTQQAPTSARRKTPLDRGVRTIAAIVVCGAIITVLDATIVSVAIETLADRFDASLPTIQWVMTGYLLAMAAVMPLSGYAADRYGGKRVWIVSLGLFVAGSALAGVAWSAGTLIAFRVVQGLGGGLVAPVGMTLVAQAAGPQRMGRAMSLVGIPMMLGPVLGPVLGGTLVSTVSWRWIFLINLPVGVATLVWSHRSLKPSSGRPADRLDRTGLLLLSPGLGALTYGLTLVTSAPSRFLLWVAGGLALLVLFVGHALRAPAPLLELRHFARRTFAAAALIQFLTGAVLIGSMLLLPLFFQQAHGESAWVTGLLLVPQGIGAAVALWSTGGLVDRGHTRAVILTGVPLLSCGFLAYTRTTDTTPYPVLLLSLLVAGLGTGCLMAPVSAAAYSVLDRAAIPRATATLNVTQRVGGILGTAAFAVVLQQHLAATGAATATDGVAAAFGATFWWPLVVAALAFVPALLLPGQDRAPGRDGDPAPAEAAPETTDADAPVGSA